MVWRFSRDLYDRRGRGQDPLLGRTSEDEITGAAPRVLAHPGAQELLVNDNGELNIPCPRCCGTLGNVWLVTAQCEDCALIVDLREISAVWEPHGLGLGPSQPEATLQAASRIAEAPYPQGPLASRRAP